MRELRSSRRSIHFLSISAFSVSVNIISRTSTISTPLRCRAFKINCSSMLSPHLVIANKNASLLNLFVAASCLALFSTGSRGNSFVPPSKYSNIFTDDFGSWANEKADTKCREFKEAPPRKAITPSVLFGWTRQRLKPHGRQVGLLWPC